MNFKLFLIVLWGLTGVLNLTQKNVSRTSYLVTWLVLMMELIANYIGG